MENSKEFQYNVIKRLLFTMKKFWYVLLIIVIAFCSFGVYAFMNGEITYTIKERVVYNASDENSGYSGYNYSDYYFDTAVDFISQKCVLDRANFYYEDFTNNWNESVEKYIEEKSKIAVKNEVVVPATKNYISTSKFTALKANDESFVVEITYNDKIESVAIDKAKILIFAAGREAVVGNVGAYKYFAQAKISYFDNGLVSSEAVNSGEQSMFSAIALGVFVAVAVAIIIMLSKNKITEACQLEFVTKTSVLDQISERKGGSLWAKI